jgi:hypothetical protein
MADAPPDIPTLLADLEQALEDIAHRISAYAATDAGQADPNRQALITLALNLLSKADDIGALQLDLATGDGPRAAATLGDATKKLEAAIQHRADLAKALSVIEHIAGLAAAVASADIAGIITSGLTVVGDLSPDPQGGGEES